GPADRETLFIHDPLGLANLLIFELEDVLPPECSQLNHLHAPLPNQLTSSRQIRRHFVVYNSQFEHLVSHHQSSDLYVLMTRCRASSGSRSQRSRLKISTSIGPV